MATKTWISIMALILAISGCATPKTRREASLQADQQWKLSRAATFIEEGNRSAAVQVLTHISSEPPVPGVTDEALFRLALLNLRPDLGLDGLSESARHLEKLQREFPRGGWTPLAARVADLIREVQEALTRENRMKKTAGALSQENGRLKEQNLALSRENQDFRQTIQKLKALELELGKGGTPR